MGAAPARAPAKCPRWARSERAPKGAVPAVQAGPAGDEGNGIFSPAGAAACSAVSLLDFVHGGILQGASRAGSG